MYSPSVFKGDPTNANDVLDYLTSELEYLSQDLQETNALDSRTVHVEPNRPREGMIAIADGTDWNPGSGAGAYVYQGGAWVWLGLQASDIDLSPFLQIANNLSDVANAATARGNLSAAVKTGQTEFISGIITAAKNQDYRIIESIPHGATLTGFTGKMASGTLTATLKINTTAVTTGALSATSTQGSVTPSAANVMVATDALVMTISSISTPVDFSFTIAYTRNLI